MSGVSAAFDPIPLDARDLLEPGWIHTAFGLGSHERVVEASAVERARTVADKLRFRVVIEDRDGGARELHCCAKAHFDQPGAGSLVTEAHVYRELLPRVDVRSPRTHHVAVDDDAGRAIIVMDDVEALGGRFLSAHHPYEVALARETLAQLAGLHAATWNDRSWARHDWLAPRLGMVEWFSDDRLQALLDDGRGPDVPAELRDAANLREAMRRSAQIPGTCVVHGDTHSGNSYLDAEGDPHWLDWQITQWGPWALDVSYHLGTVLTVDDRRAHEHELVAHYLDELTAQLDDPAAAPTVDEAVDAYAAGFAWGWFLWVITSISSRAVVLEHIPRITTAMDDHQTLRRLGVV